MLKILLLSLASAAVAFVVFGTQGTSTSSIANKIADGVLPVLCHKGTASEIPHDPLITDVVPIVADNLVTLVIVAVACIIGTSVYKMHKVPTILLRSVGFTGLFFSALVFFRLDENKAVKASCITVAKNISEFLQRGNDILTPAFQPLSYLPPLLIGVSPSHPAQEVYLHGIHPNLVEYFITVEPYLPFFYGLLAILLLVRPLRQLFWDNYIVFSTLSGLLLMALSFTNIGNPFDATEPWLVIALRAVIFVLATFVLLGVTVLASRVVAQRLSLLSLMFLFMRAHAIGVPFLGLHIDIPVFVATAVTLVSTTDTSNGAVLLWAIIAYVFKLQVLDWALLVRLLDNLGLHIAHKLQADTTEKKSTKVKGD